MFWSASKRMNQNEQKSVISVHLPSGSILGKGTCHLTNILPFYKRGLRFNLGTSLETKAKQTE